MMLETRRLLAQKHAVSKTRGTNGADGRGPGPQAWAANAETKGQVPTRMHDRDNAMDSKHHRRQPRRLTQSLTARTALLLLLSLPGLGAAAEAQPEFDCVIMPHAEVDVNGAVPGLIESIRVDRSDSVEKGQVIAELESSVEKITMELNRERAAMDAEIFLREVNLEYDRRKQQRAAALNDKNMISTDAKDEAEREAALSKWQLRMAQDKKILAELELRRAEAVVNQRVIRSPISGKVVQRYKAPGEYVENQAILRVAQLDPLRVEVIVPAGMHKELRKGMQVEVRPEADDGQLLLATVQLIDPMADPASGTLGVRLELPNPKRRFLGGLKCKSRFLTQSAAPALMQSNPLSSKAEAGRPPSAVKAAAAAARVPAATSAASPCRSAGPYSRADLAEQLKDALAPSLLNTRVRELPAANARYMVLSPLLADREESRALAARLRAAGINDLLVMNRGKYRGRIALGLYHGRSWAERRQAELTALGFDTELDAGSTQAAQWWLDFEVTPGTDEAALIETAQGLQPGVSLQTLACAPLRAAVNN